MTQRLLIIKHGAFGDLIQAMGVLQDVRQHFAHAHLTLLTAPAYRSLLEACPYIDAVLTDARLPWWQWRAQAQLGQQLAQGRFDTVIDLQNSDRSRSYRWRWLRHTHWIGRAMAEPPPPSGLVGLQQLLARHAIPTPHVSQPDLRWLVAAHGVSEWLPQAPYVVLIPGASRQHPQKRWPYYAALAAQIATAGWRPVVVLGPDEQSLHAHFDCLCLIQLDWRQLATLLSHALAVVGNDTGPSHLAAHVGARGFALFGPTSAQRAQMETANFSTWQVEHLPLLTVECVWQRLRADLVAARYQPA